MASNKLYNRFTAEDLRMLLSMYESLEQDYAEMQTDLLIDQKALLEKGYKIPSWVAMYERPFKTVLAEFIIIFELVSDFKAIASSDNPVLAQKEWLDSYLPKIDGLLDEAFADANIDEKMTFVAASQAFTMVMVRSLRCMMVYGYYLDELISLIKTTKSQLQRDKAIFKAIRIDPSIISSATIAPRISQAVVFNDQPFFKKLRNALTGKLGAREAKNFQKIRYVLQVLHESGGIHQNDKDLKGLFVKELNLYSDSAHTSEKNLNEFTSKFKKQKSTI